MLGVPRHDIQTQIKLPTYKEEYGDGDALLSRELLFYDGEPFEPAQIAARVRDIMAGKAHSLDVTEPKSSIPGNSLMITIGRSDA